MPGMLAGQHALVTGGSRGIGRAVAAGLTGAGATVTITGRTQADLQAVVDAGEAQRWLVLDAADEMATQRALTDCASVHGPIDILIANAGTAVSASFAKSDMELFRQMLDLNFLGTVAAIQAVLPGMIARGRGRIIAIASTAGLKGYPYVSAYVAAKHAVIGLVRALAIETARSGVTVNAVCPGYTDTALVAGGLDQIAAKSGRSTDEALAQMLKGVPLGRLITPQEVAAACLYLTSDGAAAVTGSTLTIAGGEL